MTILAAPSSANASSNFANPSKSSSSIAELASYSNETQDKKIVPSLNTAYPFKNMESAELFMKDKDKEQSFSVPYSSGASKSMRPQIQVYNTKSKEWEKIKLARSVDNGNSFALKFIYNFTQIEDAGEKLVRVYIPETSKTESFTSLVSSINFKKQSYGSLTIEKSGKKNIPYGRSSTYSFSIPNTVKNLTIQKYDSQKKSWIYDKRARFESETSTNRKYTWKINHDGVAKTVAYRLYAESTDTHNEYISKNLFVTFAKGKPVINSDVAIDNKNLSVRTKDKMGLYVSKAPNAKIRIQSYNTKTKKWMNSTSVKSINTTKRQKVLIPYPKLKEGRQFLRVSIDRNSNFEGISSATTKVKYVAQKKYKGVTKKSYEIIKKWCPDVTISTFKFSGNTIGHAYFPKRQIAIHPSLNGDNLRYVSIHECAHMLQLSAFNEDTQSLYERSNKVYGTNSRGGGAEIQADCITQYLGGPKTVKYSYYKFGGKCTPNQIANAKKIVEGKRF